MEKIIQQISLELARKITERYTKGEIFDPGKQRRMFWKGSIRISAAAKTFAGNPALCNDLNRNFAFVWKNRKIIQEKLGGQNGNF